jgi:3-phenylpropionate/trans-cinnamate dioxygenase ferredoxin subunit
MAEEFVKVAEVTGLAPGQMKMVEWGEDQVLLVNLGGSFYACDNICTHAGAPLNEGSLEGEQVECPLHGSVFNVTTGEVVGPPAEDELRVFQVRVDEQDILVGPPTS